MHDRVILSSFVMDQSTIKALYRKTEQTRIPVLMIFFLSELERVLSSFNAATVLLLSEHALSRQRSHPLLPYARPGAYAARQDGGQ